MSLALEAIGLGKRYRARWALSDATFEVPAGRIVALVGPNGAGKTTLLHLCAGLLAPDAGEVHVLGRRPGADAELLADVGFVAQDAPLYRSFRVGEMLTFGERMNRTWDATGARDRLARAGIGERDRVASLSGGQRAQLALSIALAKRPKMLLLDEPLASLDPLARRAFMQTLMEAAAGEGITVVLSSHLVIELERACDSLIVLSSSRTQIAGAIDELLDGHRVLIGPRRDDAPPGVGYIVSHRRTDRQSTLLVRTTDPVLDPAWTTHPVSLEELVLAYLGAPEQTALPAPRLRRVGTEAR